MTTERSIDQLCIDTIRTLSIDAVQQANSGHPGAPMGMAPVAYVLWDRFLRFDPANPDWPDRDRFVLSMGHASMLIYSLLHLYGYDVTLEDLRSFRQLGGKCAGHPEYGICPGVETTTGPLGQGVGNSVGMAIAQAWQNAHFNAQGCELFKHRVFALCSDGDLMEGVGAEAASMAGHLGLSNLVWIYDDNEITIDGRTNIAFSENVAARFQSYGWFVTHVADANNLDEVHVALEAAIAEPNRPSLIVCKSKIGFGSPNRENTSKAHGEPLGADEIKLTKQAYGWDPEATFHVPEEVRTHMAGAAATRGIEYSQQWRAMFEQYEADHPKLAAEWKAMSSRECPDGWDAHLPVFEADAKGMATRAAGGKALAAIAPRVTALMGGSADLVNSTKTIVPDSPLFSKEQPEGRNIAFGIREHAMAAAANGMSLSGMRPFVSSFLTFTDYCRPSIRLSAMMHQPVIYVFTHDSIGLGEDGPTHQAVEHVASLRAMPGLDVVRPADANETVEAWRYIMSVTDRPILLALTRQGVPTLDRSTYASASGLAKGGYVLADCDGSPDVILIGTGSELQHCVAAYESLTSEGVKVRVVSLPCWEQFERQPISYRNDVLPPSVTKRVAIEAGATHGWERYVGSEGAIIGLDRFGESAPAGEVMREFGFTAENVVKVARQVLAGGAKEGGDAMGTRIEQINAVGQSIWCDSISRSMIEGGDLQRLIDQGVVGVTSNPTIFHKAIAGSDDYDAAIENLVANGASTDDVYEALTVGDVGDAADLFKPVYERTNGLDGFVSLEVNPHLAHDTKGTVEEARRLFGKLNRPNVFIKVPATEEGIPAIETLIAEGIHVNVTLIFSRAMYAKVMEAYIRGLEKRADAGQDVTGVSCVASFFVSRVDTLVDKRIREKIDAGHKNLSTRLGMAAVGNAKLAYADYKAVFHGSRFEKLRKMGSRVQRPLWASTSAKDPAYGDTCYVDPLIGPETVNTLPLHTIDAVLDHGAVASAIEQDVASYRAAMDAIEAEGINMSDVTDELLTAGVKAFANSFDALMADLKTKVTQLQTA